MDNQKELNDDLNSLLMEEILESVMPMLKKQLPKAEKALMKSLDGTSDGVEKTVIIRTTKEGVVALIFESNKLSINVDNNVAPISVLSSADLITGLITNGLISKKDGEQ